MTVDEAFRHIMAKRPPDEPPHVSEYAVEVDASAPAPHAPPSTSSQPPIAVQPTRIAPLPQGPELAWPQAEASAAALPALHLEQVTVAALMSGTCDHGPAARSSYDSLAAQILSGPPVPPVLLVSGCRRGAGASATAAGLALAMCRADAGRVVLVDSDCRRPTLASAFGLEVRQGLAQVLAGEAALGDVLRRDEADSLYLLPAAQDEGSAFSPAVLATLFVQLRQHFDFVIVDTPPCLDEPEGLAAAPHCGGALVVVAHDDAEGRRPRRAARLLVGYGVRPLGQVVTHCL